MEIDYITSTAQIKVVVKFYYVRQFKDVLAVFPEVPWNDSELTCYAHIGQHSGVHKGYLKSRCRLATEEEYTPLLNELKSIGYNPIVNQKYRTRKQQQS